MRLRWAEGMQAYLAGEWPIARLAFIDTNLLAGGDDGPSRFLLDFIGAHGGTAPLGWPGYRDDVADHYEATHAALVPVPAGIDIGNQFLESVYDSTGAFCGTGADTVLDGFKEVSSGIGLVYDGIRHVSTGAEVAYDGITRISTGAEKSVHELSTWFRFQV